MSVLPSKILLLFGLLVVLIGLITGVPMWLAIIKNKTEGTIRAWRVAHTTLTLDGTIMVALGAFVPQLPLTESTAWLAVWALVWSGCGFIFAMVIGALKGVRGLTLKPYGLNSLLFIGHLIGAVGSIIAISILIYGSFKML